MGLESADPAERADLTTIAVYDANAGEYAQDWETQPVDDELRALMRAYLRPGGVADIGCGSGRDSAWLHESGWSVTGYDASTAMIEQARALHPEVRFETAELPGLDGLPLVNNVFCETVIMHLPKTAALAGARRMGELVRPGGRVYLSWRADRPVDWRDERGRLYTAIPIDDVLAALPGFDVVYRSETRSASSGKRVIRVVLERPE